MSRDLETGSAESTIMQRKKPKIVYSTDSGRVDDTPPPAILRSLPPQQQEAHIRRETKGRGGKTVTVILNLQLTAVDLKELAKSLKQACGSGGAVKDQTIEIQGDHRQQIAAALQKLGYKTKFVGG